MHAPIDYYFIITSCFILLIFILLILYPLYFCQGLNLLSQKQYIIKIMQKIYQQDIECIISSKYGKGAIYIGNLDAARNLNTLKKYNIKSVITMAKGAFLKHSEEDLPNYLYIPAKDHKNFDLSIYFNQTYEFIQRHKKNSNILVHCMAGVSRSVTIVIAYIMKKQKMKMIDALKKVRKMRPIIDPNEGFLCQLIKYEEQLNRGSQFTQNRNKTIQKSNIQQNKLVRSKSINKDCDEITSSILKRIFQDRINNDFSSSSNSAIQKSKTAKQKKQKCQSMSDQKNVEISFNLLVNQDINGKNQERGKQTITLLQKFRYGKHRRRYSNHLDITTGN